MSRYNANGLPWASGLGKNIEGIKTSREVMKEVGLDFVVKKCELVAKMPFTIGGNNHIDEMNGDFAYEGKVYKGHEAVEILIKNQLEGVEKAAANGMVVKVNSVLIPGLNDEHIVEIAKEVKKRGASLMNILPLIPLAKMKHYSRPDCSMMESVREQVEEIIPVFRACTQCRADAYGIPGKKSEDHHLGMTPQSHY